MFRGVAIGGAFDSSENLGQVGIQALVGIGVLHHIAKELTRVDEVTLGLDCIIFDFGNDDRIREFSILNGFISGFNVEGKVFTDEAIKERT